MPIKIRCACGNVLLAPEDRVGQTGKCPNCNRSIKVEMPHSSDTKKVAPLTENIQSSGKPFTLKRKPSWLRRLLSLPVYALFILLIAFVFSVQFFPETEIKNFCNLHLSQETWLQEQILFTRTAHRDYFLQKIYAPTLAFFQNMMKETSDKQETLEKQEAKKPSVKVESPVKEIPPVKVESPVQEIPPVKVEEIPPVKVETPVQEIPPVKVEAPVEKESEKEVPSTEQESSATQEKHLQEE